MAANQSQESFLTLPELINELESVDSTIDGALPTIQLKPAFTSKTGHRTINFVSPVLLNTTVSRAMMKEHKEYGTSIQYCCQSVDNSLLKIFKALEQPLSQITIRQDKAINYPIKFFIEQGTGSFYIFTNPSLSIKPKVYLADDVKEEDLKSKHDVTTLYDKTGIPTTILRQGPYEGIWKVCGLRFTNKTMTDGQDLTLITPIIYPAHFVVKPFKSMEIIDSHGAKMVGIPFCPKPDTPQNITTTETDIKAVFEQMPQQIPPQQQQFHHSPSFNSRMPARYNDGFDSQANPQPARKSYRPQQQF